MFGIEGRYATALFSAASKQNQLDTVEKELVKFKVCYVVSKLNIYCLYSNPHSLKIDFPIPFLIHGNFPCVTV